MFFKKKTKDTLAVGTCRLAAPAEILKKSGAGVVGFPHKLHYPAQVLQVLRHYSGKPGFNKKLLYLISEDAIRKTATREGYVRSQGYEVRSYKGLEAKYDSFIIEISALNELFIPGKGYVEYFASKDLLTYESRLSELAEQEMIDKVHPGEIVNRPLSDDEVISGMRAIADFLGGKKILWVSHFNVDGPTRVVEARQRCIDVVRKGAFLTGGSFFDPTHVVKHLGQGNALKDFGQDYAHFTDAGNECLASVYKEWMENGRHRWVERPDWRLWFSKFWATWERKRVKLTVE